MLSDGSAHVYKLHRSVPMPLWPRSSPVLECVHSPMRSEWEPVPGATPEGKWAACALFDTDANGRAELVLVGNSGDSAFDSFATPVAFR